MSKGSLPLERQILKIESSDREELSEFFSRGISSVSVATIPGARKVSIEASVAAIGDILVWRGVCPTGVSVNHRDDFPGYQLQIPLAGSSCLSTTSTLLKCDQNTGYVGAPKEADIFQYSRGWDHLAVKLPFDLVTRTLVHLLDEPLPTPLTFSPTFAIGSDATSALLSVVMFASTEIGNRSAFAASPRAADLFCDAMTTLLLETVQHNFSDALSAAKSSSVCPRHVKRALEFMRAHADQVLTLRDITLAAGISLRTLHYGFKQFVGVSPMEHLRSIRLQAACTEIANSADNVPIASIAQKWGFMNAGRFSALCKMAYGTSPSALRQNHRKGLRLRD